MSQEVPPSLPPREALQPVPQDEPNFIEAYLRNLSPQDAALLDGLAALDAQDNPDRA